MAEQDDNPWGDATPEQDFASGAQEVLDRSALIARLGLSVTAATLMLTTALRGLPHFLTAARQPGTISVIQVPDQDWGPDLALAWRLLAGSELARNRYDEGRSSDMLVLTARQRMREGEQGRPKPAELLAFDSPRNGSNRDLLVLLRDAMKQQIPVHAISHAPETLLPQELLDAADQRLPIPRMDAELLTELAVQVCGDGESRPDAIPADVVRHLRTTDLILAKRPGQSASEFLGRVEASIRARQRPIGPGLAAVPGMGQASRWAERVVEDLQACVAGELPASELDRGCVLEGPPGCGKTSLARAIAESAGVPFLAASLQEWQGAKDGHLGNLLAAMAATFSEARRLAPCVLLIDEIDSVGDRKTFDARYRDYSTQVVNGLLEQLDGAHHRRGIVIIGAANDARGLDPALLRPGRLEQIIRVELPDAAGLTAIFHHHLGSLLLDRDFTPLAEAARARMASGADVERWCRVARAVARRARRPVALADLFAEVGEPPPPLSKNDLRLAAVHEAGHAIGYLLCGEGVLQQVSIESNGLLPGVTRTAPDAMEGGSIFLTRGALRRRLRALLAGRAAELELLGDVSGGAGGSSASDLAAATSLAAVGVAAMGLDDHAHAVLWHRLEKNGDTDRLLATYPDVRQRVAVLLAESMAAACRLITQRRAAVVAVADALVERRTLTGGEVAWLVEEASRRPDGHGGARIAVECDRPEQDGFHRAATPWNAGDQ